MQAERKSAVAIEFPPVAEGCAPTVRLTVMTERKTLPPKIVDDCLYAVTEVGQIPGERAFRFDRLDMDREKTCFVRVIPGKWAECDCEAGSRGKVQCKHAAAVAAILEQEKYDPNNEVSAA